MSPIVMTLAMDGILQGAVSSSVGGSGFITTPSSLSKFASSNTLGIPNVVWVWVGACAVAVGVLRRTVYGRSLYATGSSQRVAWLSGVPCRTVVTIAYATSACVAGITGILLAGTLSQTYLGMGDSYLFPAIAAAVLGGIAIKVDPEATSALSGARSQSRRSTSSSRQSGYQAKSRRLPSAVSSSQR